jgi:imidazolonepropionase-like amidohydrolase
LTPRHLRFLPIILTLLLAGCKPPEQPLVTSIVGAVLIDGTGGPPISDSVVTIENGRIRAAGSRDSLPVPPEAQKIDGAGKFIVPAPINVAQRDPALPNILSLRDARTAVDGGAKACLHMIRDTDAVDPAFIARLRDLQIVFVPMLGDEHDPVRLGLAKRNTKRLADGGVLIAVGSTGDAYREMEMLVEAGLPPMDVLVAATRNGARALGTLAEEGTIEPGKRADLLLLTANPAEDIRNLRHTGGVIAGGQWLRR